MSLDFEDLRAASTALSQRLAQLFAERVTSTDLDKEIAKSVPAGAPGQVPFIKTDGSRFAEVDYLLHKGAFCNTAGEVTTAKGVIVNNSTIFNTWQRFSHNTTETQPALPAEITTWSYDDGTETLNNTTNSVSVIGVVSTKKYSDYVLEARLSSTDADDDMIGILLAWYVDPVTNRQYTLIAHRSPGDFTPWAITYNLGRSDEWRIADGTPLVRWGNGNFGATQALSGYTPDSAVGGWDDFPAGIKLKITREGDSIKAMTSQLQSGATYDPATELSIDLTSDPRLMKFRGPRAYGYCAWSQAFSKWEATSFTDSANTIYDLTTGQVWKYISTTDTWVVQAGESVAKNIGLGRLLFNPTTGKTFFIDGDGVITLLGDI